MAANLRRRLHIVGWALVAALLAAIGARLLLWDRRVSFVAINALLPFALVPAFAVLVLALWLRRVPLVVVAALVAGIYLVVLAPEFTARQPIPGAARRAPKITVFDGNVRAGNPDGAAYAAQIRAARPDLAVLQEASPEFVAAVDSAHGLVGLDYRFGVARRDPFAFAVASRYPLRDTSVLEVNGRPVAVRVTVETPRRSQRVIIVHAIAPFGPNRGEWMRDLAAIRADVTRDREPLLVVGDFNATWGHRAFRRLLGDGFRDGAAARGHPFQMTWPADRPFPPVMRLDHILTRGAVTVTRIRTGRPIGSDHRPLVAQVALPD